MAERTAWDAESMGFGRHSFQHVDPAAVNPEDYAQNMRGEQTTFGDVREYNSAHNEKHPENDTRLEDLARIGTVFETDAPGLEGEWMVVKMPSVKAPLTFANVCRIDADGEPIESTLTALNTADLGCAVDEENMFKQVKTRITKKGKVDKHQRERLTKRT